MAEQLDDIVDNLKESSQWIRLLFMIAFAAVLYLVMAPVILVLVFAQALFALTTGDSNRNLRTLGDVVSQYVFQILRFLTYNDERKPFPFADFPTASDITGVETEEREPASEPETVAEAKKSASKKSPAKKAAAKKTSAKRTAKKKTSVKKAKKDESGQDTPKPESEAKDEESNPAKKNLTSANPVETDGDARQGSDN